MSPPNDWQIKKCLGLSLAVLLVTLGLVGLTSVGLDVPVLSQVIGFVFLTFIPGVLLLRVLKVHNINIVESLLYSAGLSLAFDMTVGVVINFALPPLGIDRPITLCPLITCFGISLLILCALAYWRDRNYCPAAPQHEPIKKATTPGLMAGINPYLLAALLPLLAILGTGMANAYQNNLVLLGVILLVVIIIALAAFTRFIPPPAYAFTITMTALALLYQTSLTSDYLVGSDIHLERYFSRTVLESGYWDPAVPVAMNSCLSIVILAPLYSLVLNMDIVWLFKIVYPLLFCLVPLALYRIFRLQFQPRYAFFGAAFFICMPMFFMDMVQLARQQISELFFVLVILLLVDRRLTLTQRTALALVFSSGVIISHYGLGTGYTIGYLALGALVLIFIKSRSGRKAWQWLIGKSSPLPSDLTTVGAFTRAALAVVVCLSLAFMFGYYSVVASGKSLAGTRVLINVVATVSQPFVQHFTPQQEATMPPAPQNLRLARNESRTTCLTPRLEWDSLPGAASYWLQVATDKGFNNLIIDEGGISAAHYDIAAALERNTTYFWRVKALTGYGESDWSRVGRISTWPPTLAGRVKDALSSRTELPAFV
ncbi:MAG TPA: hypothetical protein EYP71_02660, partial [Dehalococcoidia bacterium]|nr:hypothetical protein [Dehalococcoidia bacterium]